MNQMTILALISKFCWLPNTSPLDDGDDDDGHVFWPSSILPFLAPLLFFLLCPHSL
jgi:hypothetical protein